MKVGSLCTGIGGLDLAVERMGGELSWQAEIQPAANEVLAARFPSVPNLGDIKDIDPDPVDVVVAGFPCQPVSTAGARRGTDDERWLWGDIERIVGRMEPRPGMLLFENVPGLLTANRGYAMARVVQGLASLGYLGSWRIVRASDVGACHRRRRVFIVAHLNDGLPAPWSWPASPAKKYFPTPVAAGGVRGPDYARVQRRLTHGSGGDDLPTAVALLPTPVASDEFGSRRDSARTEAWKSKAGKTLTDVAHLNLFGKYAEAVAHHEEVFCRDVPAPTIDGKKLSPLFVEWMMGFPEGWVTDVGLARSVQLRLLGNSVVPLQAYAAFTNLLGLKEVAA